MKNGRYETYGHIAYYKDDVLHREDGPAIEWPDGSKVWIIEGTRHRLDGPAVEFEDGIGEWWVDGQEVDVLAVFGYEPSVPLTEEEQVILRLSI